MNIYELIELFEFPEDFGIELPEEDLNDYQLMLLIDKEQKELEEQEFVNNYVAERAA